MADALTCRVCGSERDAHAPVSEEFYLCPDCKEIVRRLTLGSPSGDEDGVIAFEPIDYDYTPDDDEIVYLQPRNKFFRVELRDVGDAMAAADDATGTMIFLHPLPKSGPAKPITDMKDEIGQAIADGEFFRVTINTDAILEHEMWWRSALELAPDPAADDPGDSTGEAEETKGATQARIQGIVNEAEPEELTNERANDG